jgi:cell division septation protein DedD
MSHNLDDLIMDEPEIETPKSKSILSRIGMAIIVLIIGMIASKLILSDKGDPVEIKKADKVKEIIDPTKTDEDIVKKLSQEEISKQKSKKKQNASLESEDQIELDDSMLNSGDSFTLDDSDFGSDYARPKETPQSPTQQVQQETPKVSEPTPTPPPPKRVATPQRPHLQPQQHKTPPPKPTSSPRQKVATGKYYIQVASFSKEVLARNYAKKLKQQGYNSIIFPYKNFYKVRIGPYTLQEAKAKLKIAKSKFSPDVFIVKGK